MNRKQEAIDFWEFRKIFIEECVDFIDCKGIDRKPALRHFYDRLAPLMRGEFPEEILRSLLTDKDLWTEEGLLYQIKILFEGGDHIAEVGEKVGDSVPEQPKSTWNPPPDETIEYIGPPKEIMPEYLKGTCPTCGGSRRVPRKPPQYISAKFHDNPCPDCKGTGECQHKGKLYWFDPHNKTGPPKCLNCGEEVERRIGAERRIAEPIIMTDTNFVYSEYSERLGRTIYVVDCRKLLDRRKAA